MDPDTYDVAFPNGFPSMFSSDENKVENEEVNRNSYMSSWAVNAIVKSKNTQLQQAIAENNLVKVQKRLITDKPIPFMQQNGCCIPGQRRLYVTVEGDFRVCERIGKSPSIGNVDRGIDFESLYKKYILSYKEHAVSNCNNCWCVHLCGICYCGFCRDDGIDFEKKFRFCNQQREVCKNNLVDYHSILEKRPDWLEHLNDIQLI